MNETEVPVLRVPGPLSVAVKEQAQIRVGDSALAAPHIHPGGGLPQSGKVVAILVVSRDLFVGASVKDDALRAIPVAVEVDNFVAIAVFQHADNVDSIHPGDGLERDVVVEQHIVVVRGGEKITRFAQGVERVEDIAVRRADLADSVFEPLFEDARGHAAKSLCDGGSSGDEILGSRVFSEHRAIDVRFSLLDLAHALGFIQAMLQ